VKSLYEAVNTSNLSWNSTDYKKFRKDYDKFLDHIKKDKVSEKIQHALDMMSKWIEELDKQEGLPMSYGRYEQFTYAFVTYDSSQRDGAGGLYDEDTTNQLIKAWEKSTGYKIVSQYHKR
jgi:hypothetical protein